MRLVVWLAGLSVFSYVTIALPIKYSVGETTVIKYLVGVVGDFKLNLIIPYALSAALFGLWQRERSVRKNSIAREHDRLVELEREKDPDRESSGLKE